MWLNALSGPARGGVEAPRNVHVRPERADPREAGLCDRGTRLGAVETGVSMGMTNLYLAS